MSIVEAAAIGCTGFILGRGFSNVVPMYHHWRTNRYFAKKQRAKEKATA